MNNSDATPIPRSDSIPNIEDFLTTHSDDDRIPYCGTLQAAVLPQGDISFFHGPPKSIKTWMLADMALCIATGKPWIGTFPCRRARVLYIQADGPRFKWRERLLKLMNGLGITQSDLSGWFRTDMRNGRCLASKSHVEGLIEACGDWKPQVVFFDPLAKFIAGELDENSNHDMAILIARLETLQTAWPDCSIALTQHETKNSDQDGGGRMRGATTLWASGNTCRVKPLSKFKSEVDISLKDYDGPAPFSVQTIVSTEIATVTYLGEVEDADRRDNEARIALSIEDAQADLSFNEIADATGIPRTTVRETVKYMLENRLLIEAESRFAGGRKTRLFGLPE